MVAGVGEPPAFGNAGEADQYVSQTAVCDTRAMTASGAHSRVSYPVSDSVSYIPPCRDGYTPASWLPVISAVSTGDLTPSPSAPM